jgi:RHS repeat-associated protein
MLAEEAPNGYAHVTYMYGLELLSQNSDSAPARYYVHDGHGSVRALTDVNGNITDTYDYDAFGNLIHSTGTSPNNYLFAGEQFDPDLNLYYNRARYVNTTTGRFWSPDTVQGGIDDPLSLHRYLYAHGDPVDLLDPSGKTPLTDFVLLLATKGVSITARAFGILAHQYIQRDIMQRFPGQALTELGIVGGRIDVLILPNEVYEIKPFGGTVDPERQISRYIDSTGDLFGSPLVRGTFQFERIIDGPLGLTQINYLTTSPGVIEYTAFPSVKLVATAIAFVLTYNIAQLFLDVGASIALGAALAPGIL